MHIGFIGLGNMGRAIAANLLKGGHSVTVWNRSPATAEPLEELGARIAATPHDACAAEIVFSVLADDQALEQVFLDSGVLARTGKDTVHVNMATISVACAQKLARRHAEHGVGYVAMPVLGRPDSAAAAKLTLLVAGDPARVQAVQPLFPLISHKSVMLGEEPFRANALKLAVNFMLTSAVETLAEASAMAAAYDIGTDTLVDLITSTIFPGPIYAGYGGLMVREQYEPAGFKARLGLKDVLLAQAAAKQVGVPLGISEVVVRGLQAAIDQGVGEHDLAVLGQVAKNAMPPR